MKKFLFVATFSAGSLFLSAQSNLTNDKDPDQGVIYPTFVGISRPLAEIWEEEKNLDALRDQELAGTASSDKNFNKRQAQTFLFDAAENGAAYGNDENFIQNEHGFRDSPGVKTHFAGLGNGGVFPYDPSGAAGPNHYVQAVNATTYKIFNKTNGANMGSGSVGSLWSPATGNLGDPIIMYDRFAGRWFISQFGSGNAIYIAISTTNDPTGSYYTYSFTSPQFPDYLKFSIWRDGYYMTCNTGTQRVFCFERSVMLTGGTARSVYSSFNPPRSGGFFCPMPGDADGDNLPTTGGCPILSYEDNGWGGSFTDQINIFEAMVTWGTTPALTIPVATGSPINTAAFDASYNASWNDVTQPNTTQKLDGIGGILQYRAQWRAWATYNSVVINWPVKISANQRSIMWAELRQTGGTWAIYQQGIYTPDAYTRWVGSIAMDDEGNIALCYVKSGTTPTNVFPSLGYTGRRPSDPINVMTFNETIVSPGTASQTGANRFGDYAQTTLDPDGLTFWHTGMWCSGTTGTNAGKTRIYNFRLSSILGTDEEASDAEYNPFDLNVYPMPSNGNFNITFHAESNENYTLNLYNELGQIVLTKEITNQAGSQNVSVGLENPSAGLYNLIISNGKVESYKKLVIQ